MTQPEQTGHKKEIEMKNVKAQIIGETSAGGLMLEIYENDTLVYSVSYFDNGASSHQYDALMLQARIDAEGCADWRNYDGCERDEDGGVARQNKYETNWIIAEYSDGAWHAVDSLRGDGMATDWLFRNLDIAEIVGLDI